MKLSKPTDNGSTVLKVIIKAVPTAFLCVCLSHCIGYYFARGISRLQRPCFLSTGTRVDQYSTVCSHFQVPR